MKTLWRFIKGGMVPEDEQAVMLVRESKYRVGDVVCCEITMPRSKVFMQAMHKMARLLIQNTDRFTGWREHDVIKYLQVESRTCCDVERIDVLGHEAIRFTPRSLAFDQMDEGEFRIVVDRLVDHVAAAYWPDFSLELLDEVEGA